ncbi:hypothetical protein V5G24_23540 [Xanthobacter sp. VTT E-85241]|jgi:hypothetical protein|uniref:hypothetical protein n=1 Tax=Roseixanthobacter finlandensis TaxID=3119922 RepID=UPI00372B3FE2
MTTRNEKIRQMCVELAARSLNMSAQNVEAARTFANILAGIYDPLRIDQPDDAYADSIALGLHQLYGYDDDLSSRSRRFIDEAVRAWARFVEIVGYQAARQCDTRTFAAVEIMQAGGTDRHAAIYRVMGAS